MGASILLTWELEMQLALKQLMVLVLMLQEGVGQQGQGLGKMECRLLDNFHKYAVTAKWR